MKRKNSCFKIEIEANRKKSTTGLLYIYIKSNLRVVSFSGYISQYLEVVVIPEVIIRGFVDYAAGASKFNAVRNSKNNIKL